MPCQGSTRGKSQGLEVLVGLRVNGCRHCRVSVWTIPTGEKGTSEEVGEDHVRPKWRIQTNTSDDTV